MQTLSLSRFDLLYAVGRVPHDQRIATIELYGREVIPRVRELLAATPEAGRAPAGRQELTMAAAATAFAEGVASAANPEVDDLRLGIVGAGKFGTTLARAAIAAGYDVAISGSGPADDIALTVDVLAPGARAATTDEVVRHADIIVLAVPTHRFRELPRDLFAGKILIDAMNYWQPVDGDDPELTTAPGGTSTIVQERFPSARVVKSLNQLGYHQLEENSAPQGSSQTASRSARPATTGSPSGRSCGSSTGSASTLSMPGR